MNQHVYCAQSHQYRVEVLETLASLTGSTLRYEDRLVSGKRPDVLRYGGTAARLFVGEAKFSESWTDSRSINRLLNYLQYIKQWLAAGGSCDLVVCCGAAAEAAGWLGILKLRASSVGLSPLAEGVYRIDEHTYLSWLLLNAEIHVPARVIPNIPTDSGRVRVSGSGSMDGYRCAGVG